MKLWQKSNLPVNEETQLIEAFTIGDDSTWDMLLAPHDVAGSMAHSTMLNHIGLLDDASFTQVKSGLQELYRLINNNQFRIEPGVEDIHSQVELWLTQKMGEAGKRIHSGRSRNDQVLLDIKLYLRQAVKEITEDTAQLIRQLLQLSHTHREALMPGYTHMQVAMPSSFGLWFGAYAECLVDDLDLLAGAFKLVNRNPLGSGAGFGSSFPLDRELTTNLLGFERMHYNVVTAQMSRGKTEKAVAQAIAMLGATLSRLAMDACMYMNPHFGLISFPDHLTTGSSIMPHKKNPDVMELIRAHGNRLQSLPNELSLLMTNLPSGYHRDMQLTKGILFPGIQTLKSCLQMMMLMLNHIQVNKDTLDKPECQYLFSVEAVNQLVLEGMPFRDAYKTVGGQIEDGSFKPSGTVNHTHAGSIGNLCLPEIERCLEQTYAQFNFGHIANAIDTLMDSNS